MSVAYGPRVERAILFILANLEGRLTLAEVAHAARLSPFHFHRVFAGVAGEPVGRFITRTRLQVAALRIVYERDRDITDIALSSGYSSPSNFTKAFTQFYGCSPSALRAPRAPSATLRGRLRRDYGQSMCPSDLYGSLSCDAETSRVEDVHAGVRFVSRPQTPLCCLAAPRGAGVAEIGRSIQALKARARELGLDAERSGVLGIRFDHELLSVPALSRYHVCVPCWEGFVPPAPLFASHLPAGRYAVFRLVGTSEAVLAQYRDAYARWPAASSVMLENLWPIEHFARPAPPGRLDFDLWLKVRPRR